MIDLTDVLEGAGLRVDVFGPPAGYDRSWGSGGPVGQMVHHTAPPNPYPMDSLAGRRDGRVKCNVSPRQDGTLVVVTSHACNYSSGSGSRVVLDEVRAGVAPSGSARSRGLTDDTNGNPWFVNWEVDHPGDGSPIPAAQWEALVAGLRAVNDALALPAGSTICHAEWTARKHDPYWNGLRAHDTMNQIRSELEGYVMTPTDVAKVQNYLNRWDERNPLDESGVWDAASEARMVEFQEWAHVEPTGQPNPLTLATLAALVVKNRTR